MARVCLKGREGERTGGGEEREGGLGGKNREVRRERGELGGCGMAQMLAHGEIILTVQVKHKQGGAVGGLEDGQARILGRDRWRKRTRGLGGTKDYSVRVFGIQ